MRRSLGLWQVVPDSLSERWSHSVGFLSKTVWGRGVGSFFFFSSVSSICIGFEQLSGLWKLTVLSGSYRKCWYCLWYNLTSNCKNNILRVPQILSGFWSGAKKTKWSHSMQDCTEPCNGDEATAVSDLAVKWPFGLKISAGIMCLMVPDRLLLGIPWSLGHCIGLLSASLSLFSYRWKEK